MATLMTTQLEKKKENKKQKKNTFLNTFWMFEHRYQPDQQTPLGVQARLELKYRIRM